MKVIFIFASLFCLTLSFSFEMNETNLSRTNKEHIESKCIVDSLFSNSLNRDLNYVVYLPDAYFSDAERKFDVLYLLHGHGENEMYWKVKGNIQRLLDSLRKKKSLRDFVVIMPDGGNSWYVDAKEKMESAIVSDLMPFIVSKYRINDHFENRSIAGLSAGGFGSLRIVLKHPELFSNVVLMSPAIFPTDPVHNFYARKNVVAFQDEKGDFSDAIWNSFNYPNYWSEFDVNSKEFQYHFYLSTGKTDCYPGIIESVNHILPLELDKRKDRISYTIKNYKGGHEISVWQKALIDGISSIYKK